MVMIHLLEEERKKKKKKKKKKRNAGKRGSAYCSWPALKTPQCPDHRWSAKVIYLVSHSGRTLLPQTQGRRHVSQHLIHVRVRHAAPGSTENKNGSGDGEPKEGQVKGGEETEEKPKPKPKPYEPKNIERKMQRTIK